MIGSSEDGFRCRLWLALAAGWSHWMLAVVVQTGNFLAYLLPAGAPLQHSLGYLARLVDPLLASSETAHPAART